MSKLKNAEKIYIPDRKTLRAWFVKNHAQVESFWLVYDKVKDGKRHLTYDDLVEESLCFGFIDSQPRKVSETQASYYISRRKPKSEWSKRNKEKVAELIKKKQMHVAGHAAIARAKENGSWSKIDGSENHVMPEDFAKVLKKQPKLRKHFESLAPSSSCMTPAPHRDPPANLSRRPRLISFDIVMVSAPRRRRALAASNTIRSCNE